VNCPKKKFWKKGSAGCDEHLSVYIVAYHCMKFFAYSPECKDIAKLIIIVAKKRIQ
jgi:hypothetical protein